MPSCRVQMEIMGLRPGHRPEAVLDAAVGSVASAGLHVDDRQVDVVAGTPRITVRFTVPDSGPEEERSHALETAAEARQAVERVAVVGRWWVLRRLGGRWVPLS